MNDLEIFYKVLLAAAGGLITLAGAGAAIAKAVNYAKSVIKKWNAETSALSQPDVDELKESVKSIIASLATIKEHSEQNFADIKQTLQDVTRQTLKTMHDECMSEGYISEHMYFCFVQLSDDYINRLNGNSFIVDYKRDIDRLNSESRKKDLVLNK